MRLSRLQRKKNTFLEFEFQYEGKRNETHPNTHLAITHALKMREKVELKEDSYPAKKKLETIQKNLSYYIQKLKF